MEQKEPSIFETDTKVYKLYDDCVDERGREKAGLKPAKHFLWKFGGWPVLEDQDNLFAKNHNYRYLYVTVIFKALYHFYYQKHQC